MKRQKVHLGSLNILDFAADGRGNPIITSNDPIIVKKEIKLSEVEEKLFTTINSGVRFWPFLLIARDFDGIESTEKILSALKKIQKRHPRENIGPKTIATFNFYRSMYRRLKYGRDAKSEDLRRFIENKKRKYKGDFNFFSKHEKDWKAALVKSMGKPGREYATLLDKLKSDSKDSDIVEESITQILKNKHDYDESLWKGAFCYVFLRFMYGVSDGEQQAISHKRAKEWANELIKILSDPRMDVSPRIKGSIRLIEGFRRSPPWQKVALKLKSGEHKRMILAGLRFRVFYNLYLTPSPLRERA